MKREAKTRCAWAFAVALAVVGCKGSQPVAPVDPAPAILPADSDPAVRPGVSVVDDEPGEPWPIKSTALLELVPADTPYLYANLEPIPRAVVKRLKPWFEPLMVAGDRGYQDALADDPPEQAKVVRETLGEHFTVETLEKMGVDPNPRFIVYGIGLAPVVRVRLGDADRFREMVRLLDGLDGETSEQRVFHGQEYWFEQQEDGELVVLAVVGSDFVLAVLPAGVVQRDLLPLVFGQHLPSSSMATTGRLTRLLEDHQLTGHFAGFVDIEGLARTILGQTRGLDRRVADAMGAIQTGQSPECSAEWTRLARAFPRAVFGFDELSARRVKMSWIWETEPAIARAMSEIAAPIPGLPADGRHDGLMVAGIGVDLHGVRSMMSAFASAVAREPFRCDDLAWITQSAPQLASASAMVPPALADVTGVGITLYDYEDGKDGTDPMVDAVSVVGVRDPRAALEAIASLTSEVRLEKLDRPRKPVKFTDVVASSGASSPSKQLDGSFLAYGKRGIAWSMGKTGRRNLLKSVDRQRPQDGAVVVGSLDMPGLFAKAPEVAKKRLEEMTDPAARKAAEALLGMMGRLEYRVKLTGRGMDFEVELEVPRAK